MSVLLFLSYQRFILSAFAHYFQYYYLPPLWKRRRRVLFLDCKFLDFVFMAVLCLFNLIDSGSGAGMTKSNPSTSSGNNLII